MVAEARKRGSPAGEETQGAPSNSSTGPADINLEPETHDVQGDDQEQEGDVNDEDLPPLGEVDSDDEEEGRLNAEKRLFEMETNGDDEPNKEGEDDEPERKRMRINQVMQAQWKGMQKRMDVKDVVEAMKGRPSTSNTGPHGLNNCPGRHWRGVHSCEKEPLRITDMSKKMGMVKRVGVGPHGQRPDKWTAMELHRC